MAKWKVPEPNPALRHIVETLIADDRSRFMIAASFGDAWQDAHDQEKSWQKAHDEAGRVGPTYGQTAPESSWDDIVLAALKSLLAGPL